MKNIEELSESDPDFAYFLEMDTSQYEGRWIAIYDREVVCSSEREERVRKIDSQRFNGKALVTKIPTSDHAMLL